MQDIDVLTESEPEAAADRPSCQKRKRTIRKKRPDSADPLVLQKMLAKPCDKKCKRDCRSGFRQHAAFQELLKFRQKWKGLHNLDQDTVVPSQADLNSGRHELNCCGGGSSFKLPGVLQFSSPVAMMMLAIKQPHEVFQTMQKFRDKAVENNCPTEWTFLGRPVCFRSWLRLQNLGAWFDLINSKTSEYK